MPELIRGLKGAAKKTVANADPASAHGNPRREALSSVTLMTLLGQACLDAIADHIDPHSPSVCSRMEMDHPAPTPPGFTIRARAVHARRLLGRKRFLQKAAAKAAQGDR